MTSNIKVSVRVMERSIAQFWEMPKTDALHILKALVYYISLKIFKRKVMVFEVTAALASKLISHVSSDDNLYEPLPPQQ